MKSISSIITVLAASILVWSCGDNTPKRIVSETPIKTDVLGLKLCDESSERAIKNAITKISDRSVQAESKKYGVGTGVRAMPVSLELRYGGLSWTYVDVILNEDKKIVSISMVASYESIERAKDQFDAAIKVFTQKYGIGNYNDDHQNVYWTDDINSVGLTYEESSAINGNDRSFCTLYYVNIELATALEIANTPDV